MSLRMATQASKMSASKPSFASVVAMTPSNCNGRASTVRQEVKDEVGQSDSTPPTKLGVVRSPSASQLHDELHSSIAKLSVRENNPTFHAVVDRENGTLSRAGLRLEDNQTQISSSSTKPASLDGKSATSGTTFALDEKESLRPDDSASVKAADEEDLCSGPASGTPSSRVGSEAGSRAFRDQFHEINERMGPGPHRSYPFSRRGITGIEEEAPQLAITPLVAKVPIPITLQRPETALVDGAPFGFEYHEPDEKLFEALESPKDRMFLLRLEQDVIAFVKDSKEPMIDLPPCNSFCRLLAHKLADYYALTHFVDNAVSSVRLYRTPYCRIPTPLAAIPRLPASVDAAPFQPAVKIMRRAGMGKDILNESGADTTESSINPSKAGSEAGEDSQRGTGFVSPSDSVTAKDKATMTREEREAKYKETRERIFKGFEDIDNVDSVGANEVTNQVSRASSVNEKKKAKKRNNDDGFEARSKFNAYYPTVHYAGATYDQTPSSATYYNPYNPQANMSISQPGTLGVTVPSQAYQPGYPPMANSPTFPMAMQQISAMNSTYYNGLTQNPPAFPIYNQPTHAQYYQPVQPQMGMGQQPPPMSSSTLSNNGQLSRSQSQMSDQQWQQNSYPHPYSRPRDQQQYYPPPVHDQASAASIHPVPYQYGQLPYQAATLPGGRTQHPLPGSYSRQAFNPQTRAFVPNAGVASQGPSFGGMGYDSTTRGPGVPLANGNDMVPYVTSYSQLPSTSLSGTLNQNLDLKGYGSRNKSSAQANGAQSPILSSLSKYGAPAHLPPKPPPPETPSLPDAQHALPSSVHAAVSIQLLSNGQPMPSFQNGIYSMPGVGDH